MNAQPYDERAPQQTQARAIWCANFDSFRAAFNVYSRLGLSVDEIREKADQDEFYTREPAIEPGHCVVKSSLGQFVILYH